MAEEPTILLKLLLLVVVVVLPFFLPALAVVGIATGATSSPLPFQFPLVTFHDDFFDGNNVRLDGGATAAASCSPTLPSPPTSRPLDLVFFIFRSLLGLFDSESSSLLPVVVDTFNRSLECLDGDFTDAVILAFN